MKNLVIRAVTGALFVAVLVGSILYSPLTFGLLFAFISGLSAWEFATIVNRRAGVRINRPICSMAATYLFVAAFFSVIYADALLFVPYFLVMLYLVIEELYKKSETAIGNLAFTMMSQMYVALPFALLNILEFEGLHPGIYVLALFIFLWCSDTGAYLTGSLIGCHKLFPSVSPGKTWEGSIGGGVLAVAMSVLVCIYLEVGYTFADVLFWAGMALTVVVFGTWGDLIESLIKRRLGIKDSGHALPGHGGWLDRFDSTLLATPAVIVYLQLWESFSREIF